MQLNYSLWISGSSCVKEPLPHKIVLKTKQEPIRILSIMLRIYAEIRKIDFHLPEDHILLEEEEKYTDIKWVHWSMKENNPCIIRAQAEVPASVKTEWGWGWEKVSSGDDVGLGLDRCIDTIQEGEK